MPAPVPGRDDHYAVHQVAGQELKPALLFGYGVGGGRFYQGVALSFEAGLQRLRQFHEELIAQLRLKDRHRPGRLGPEAPCDRVEKISYRFRLIIS